MYVKAVIFDWHGTLCDSTDLYFGYVNSVLRAHGKEALTQEVFKEICRKSNWKELFQQRSVDNPAVAREEFFALTRTGPQPNLSIDALDTLHWLRDRNISRYVVSAHPTKELAEIIAHHHVTELVDFFQGNATTEEKALLVEAILKERNLKPEEVIFVDDNSNVLKHMRRVHCHLVGVSSIGIASYEDMYHAGSDRIITRLKYLQRFIDFLEHMHRLEHAQKK